MEKKNLEVEAVATPAENKKNTYQDLIEMDYNKRYELMGGDFYLMSAPNPVHQLLVLEIASQIKAKLQDSKNKVFVGPLELVLSDEKENNKILDVVQPDIMVCDPATVQTNYVTGALNLVIEILSPSTEIQDKLKKFNLYHNTGVKEYLIVDFASKIIYPYILNKQGIYEMPKVYDIGEEIHLVSLKDITVSLKPFFIENKDILQNNL